jgi:hypothetical protein
MRSHATHSPPYFQPHELHYRNKQRGIFHEIIMEVTNKKQLYRLIYFPLYMFRAMISSIIRSTRLYLQYLQYVCCEAYVIPYASQHTYCSFNILQFQLRTVPTNAQYYYVCADPYSTNKRTVLLRMCRSLQYQQTHSTITYVQILTVPTNAQYYYVCADPYSTNKRTVLLRICWHCRDLSNHSECTQ